MSENNSKPLDKTALEKELLSGEARPAEESSLYGDETDTPARLKKNGKKKKTNVKKSAKEPPLFSMRYFRNHSGFFDWISSSDRKESRSVTVFGHRVTFGPVFAVILIFILVGVVVLDNGSMQVDSKTVTVVGLPADLEGYTILVLSDMNGQRFGDGQASLLRRLENLDYDCVFLLGDMVGKDGDPKPLYELLEGLGTRRPVYFICGDSDPGPYVPVARPITGTLEQMLLEDWILGAMDMGAVYVDSPICVKVGSASLWLSPATQLNINSPKNLDRFKNQVEQETEGVLAGLDADYAAIPYTSYRLQLAQELSSAINNMSPTNTHISLAHQIPSDDLITASCLHDASSKIYLSEADLILGGHYCGGVMRLPILGALYVDAPSMKRYGWFPDEKDVSGLNTVAESQTYVTRGLSTNSDVPLMPFRLLNQPQISLITLTATLPESLIG